MENSNQFSFNVSLSILNHLGRNLYRSFITVLGEAISNAWDADAENVWLYIDKEKSSFVIKDDGIGMNRDDFQDKFLKIGYSKRKEGRRSEKGRPYIGRKGIGKLALLSCADKINVISRKNDQEEYIGGIIDNSGLDQAIKEDLTPNEYKLGKVDLGIFKPYVDNHERGTLVYFENIQEGIRNSSDYLKKALALYFRFSLIDEGFNIFLNDQKVTQADLKELADKTEFLWIINDYNDPYLQEQLANTKESKPITVKGNFKGFIASVKKPRDLKVISADERVSIDLFTNGRLREKDILMHIPSARIVESYLYGQIHFDELDDVDEMDDVADRFSSSREGIVSDDPKFKTLLEILKDDIISVILEDWDKWRIKHRKDGDSENKRIALRERKSLELYNSVSEEYVPPEGSENKEKIDGWIDGLADDAKYNFSSYAECFTSENLVRIYIEEKGTALSGEAKSEIQKMRTNEANNKKNCNSNIDIRQGNNDLSYLDMGLLAKIADKQQGSQNCLPTDAKEYKPIRDALMHTALLTAEAKTKLTAVYNNIKGRIKTLISSNE